MVNLDLINSNQKWESTEKRKILGAPTQKKVNIGTLNGIPLNSRTPTKIFQSSITINTKLWSKTL